MVSHATVQTAPLSQQGGTENCWTKYCSEGEDTFSIPQGPFLEHGFRGKTWTGFYPLAKRWANPLKQIPESPQVRSTLSL